MKYFRAICLIVTVLVVCIGMGFISPAANAVNTIYSIEMSVYIDPDGTANITEVWKANLNEGTEGYKPYGNLGDSEIIDFTVTDDTGMMYTNVGTWDVYGSFSDKMFKNGFNRSGDDLELCWGISKYGHRTYTLNYKITKFVNQYNDAQGVYFGLMPREMLQPADSVKITIYTDVALSADNAKIWGFGYDGEMVFENGKIVMDSDGYFSQSSYMVALIKFEEDYFTSGYPTDKNFEDELALAMEGATPNDDDISPYPDYDPSEEPAEEGGIINFLLKLIFIAFPLAVINGVKLLMMKMFKTNDSQDYRVEINTAGGKLPPIEQVDYWREVPCGGDLLKAYWLIIQYAIHDKKDAEDVKTGLMGAHLLKWLREGKIKLGSDGKSLIFQTFDDTDGLYTFFANGVRKNGGLLEQRAFKKYCEYHYDKLKGWFSKILRLETDRLMDRGAVIRRLERDPRFRFSRRTWSVYDVTPVVRNEALKLLGLKRFLLDFSIIAQREAIEVHMWDEYLMFAQLLGIADKVQEQFKRLYPDFDRASPMAYVVSAGVIHGVASLGYQSMTAGYNRALRASASFSGGGGSSFSGGGRGSRGGGSRGGGFR